MITDLRGIIIDLGGTDIENPCQVVMLFFHLLFLHCLGQNFYIFHLLALVKFSPFSAAKQRVHDLGAKGLLGI